jgi:hypothetical protein
MLSTHEVERLRGKTLCDGPPPIAFARRLATS